MHIHIENDASAPRALHLSVKQLQLQLDAHPPLRSHFTLSENRDPAHTADFLARCDILWSGRKLALDQFSTPRLGWVQVMSAGVEQWLAHWPQGVTLTNASGVHGDKGAEFILMAALMFNFGIPGFLQDQAQRVWRPTFGGCARGKIVLLLGVGGIGAAAATLLTAQGYRVIGVTRSGQCDANVARCIRIDALDEVLPQVDVVVSTLPLTPQTRNLFDRRRLDLLPARAGIVIVGRADVFDYSAMREKLNAGELAGAVLDVYPQEPLPADDPLWHTPGVVMTPHCSLDDHSAYLAGCLDVFIDNLARFRHGQPLRNQVDPARGY
ncbi:D-2-hydroxyacid dehydrogenase [Pantoea sp. DY-5]|uniref:D-2-hydroxyacid dehydrogenase n=1 Tax=Pantoea sp. DY-5 TaxID=2871488 RepID=UPI001C96ADF8|nr:D-2-hydroxyacid dehydrogenase [Pantoea sp. DY-5]MBY4840575.1 D-2-hydroxyacid dehydrogenase [Pantoea sp. DY-5]